MHDGWPHTVYLSDLDPNVETHQRNALESVYQPTSLDYTVLSYVNELTDLVVYDQNYSDYCGKRWHVAGSPDAGYVGLTTCVSLAADGSCQKHEVRYDLSWFNAQHNDNNLGRRHLTCHETGHSLGLMHTYEQVAEDETGSWVIGGDLLPQPDLPGVWEQRGEPPSCMEQGNPRNEWLHEHDVAHLNGNYTPGTQTLGPDATLRGNDRAVSWDGRYHALMQNDGNFVVYGPGGPVWASGTAGFPGAYARMQSDGNFVVYFAGDPHGEYALCSTHTNGKAGAYMRMQTDGNLVIYHDGSNPRAQWATQSGSRCW